MDWPLTGAVAGVAALAVVVAYGAITVMRPAPAPAKKAPQLPALVWTEPRAGSVVSITPRSSPSNILALDNLTPAEPEPLSLANAPSRLSTRPPASITTPVRTRPSNTTIASLTAPSEPKKTAVAYPPEPRKTALAYPPTVLHLANPEPKFQPSKEIRRYDGVLTPSEIGRVRNALRLTADQQAYWPPVEAALRDIGRHQMAQLNTGQKVEVESSSVQRLYLAAQPLIGTMRPDQKEQVRRLARSLGYASYASMI